MTLTVQATYENGVLKPTEPLPLKENEKVRLTIEPQISVAQQTAGMIQWNGDFEELRRVVEGVEFGIMESA